jgi:LuxR family maltose regulon positive regulatory protein
VDRLSRAVSAAQLTVLCAPAGTGKTVLAAQWAEAADHANGHAVAWLTLGPSDGSPAAFWCHLLDAVGDLLPERADVRVPVSGETLDPIFIDELADRLAGRPLGVTLVLDRFELVHRRTCVDLDRLLQRAGDGLRLVLLTRTPTGLPLHRYRLEGRLAEIGADELCFTLKSTIATLTAHGLRPTGPAADLLQQATQGWPAAVRFVALALQEHRWTAPTPDQMAACLSTLETPLGDYLAAEVIAAIPEPGRDLLRCCSVADSFSSDLAGRLAGGLPTGTVLEDLARAGGLVEVDGTGRYRTHPLVRATLYSQLRERDPAAARGLHRLMTEVLAASGQPAEAVEQAARTGDGAFLVRVLVDSWAVACALLETRDGVVDGWTTGLPAEIETLESAVVSAARAVASRDLGRARMWMAKAAGFGMPGAAAELSLTLVGMRVCMASGDAEGTLAAVEDARAMLARTVREGAEHPSAHAIRAGLDSVEGEVHLHLGELDTAAGLFADALLDAAKDESGTRSMRLLAMLSLVEACRGNLTRAYELSETAEGIADDVGVPSRDRSPAVALARAWVAIERQQLSSAQRWLGRAERARETSGAPLLAGLAALLRVRLMRDRGQCSEARRLVARVPVGTAWLRLALEEEAVALGVAPTGTVRGVRTEPCPGVGSVLIQGEEQRVQTVPCQVVRLVCQARRHLQQGREGDAHAVLLTALSLGEEEQVRRPFRHAGADVRALMRSDPEIAHRSEWLAPSNGRIRDITSAEPVRPLGSPEDGGRPLRGELHEPLTEREQEVLRRLADLLSTQEIAASMFISVNTVRTHVRHILEKLAVGRRTEAVRRARELGLV